MVLPAGSCFTCVSLTYLKSQVTFCRMVGKVGVFESTKNHITTMMTETTEMDLTDALQDASGKC